MLHYRIDCLLNFVICWVPCYRALIDNVVNCYWSRLQLIVYNLVLEVTTHAHGANSRVEEWAP